MSLISATHDETKRTLTLVLDLDTKGVQSASGKTKVHATTRGNQPTSVVIDGKPLIVGVNAYTK